ncbi:MAG: hypothetical protein ACLU4N_18980 [Butyricimonas faecihominis]
MDRSITVALRLIQFKLAILMFTGTEGQVQGRAITVNAVDPVW